MSKQKNLDVKNIELKNHDDRPLQIEGLPIENQGITLPNSCDGIHINKLKDNPLLHLEKNHYKSIIDNYYLWRSELLISINELDIESQLELLKDPLDYPDFPESDDLDIQAEKYFLHLEHLEWHMELLFNLKKRHDFSNKLLPTWTIAVQSNGGIENSFSYIEASIEHLRSLIAEENPNQSKSATYDEQLLILLNWTFKTDLNRFFHHYFMLMRSATIPFADNKLMHLFRSDFKSWKKPIAYICMNALSFYERKEMKFQPGNFNQPCYTNKQIIDFYNEISKYIVDFCLSRLKLKNNITEINGYYQKNQLIELSPIWRQGYLQVLGVMRQEQTSEIINVINLVRKSDPDESVRLIANQTFSIIKNNSSSFENVDDFYRCISMAELFLLYSQRKNLKLPIDHYLDQEDIPF